MKLLRQSSAALLIFVIFATCGPSLGLAPEIVVCLDQCPASTPTGVEYRRVQRGTTEPKTLILWNRGTVELEVTSVTLAKESAEFAIVMDKDKQGCPSDSFRLSLGSHDNSSATCELVVTYTPMDAGEDDNALVIVSNDPVSPRKEVPLFSSEIGPRLLIDPATIDFGLVENRAGPVTAHVTNVGTEPVDVVGLEIAGSTDEFCVSFEDSACAAKLAVARTLDPKDSFDVAIAFSEVDNGSGAGQLSAEPADATVAPGRATLAGPPVARCDKDMREEPLVAFEIDGSPSLTPGGSICRYAWTADGPSGSINVGKFNKGEALEGKELESCPAGQNSVERPCFIADTPGQYEFSLQIVDCRSNCALKDPGETCDSDEACCSFDCAQGQKSCGEPTSDAAVCAKGGGCEIDSAATVCPVSVVPEQSLYVTLAWDGTVDMDLYVVRCSGEDPRWTTSDAVYWSHPTQDWCEPRETNGVVCTVNADCADLSSGGMAYEWCLPEGETATPAVCTDATDDPFLEIDATNGLDRPEAIAVDLPCADTYAIGVDFFGCGQGQGNACEGDVHTATVQIFVLGLEIPGSPIVADMTRHDFWTVGRVVLPDTLSCACFQAEPVAKDINPVPDRVVSQLPSPCANAPYVCDPDPCVE